VSTVDSWEQKNETSVASGGTYLIVASKGWSGRRRSKRNLSWACWRPTKKQLVKTFPEGNPQTKRRRDKSRLLAEV